MMLLSIELNLILWLTVVGVLLADPPRVAVAKATSVIALVLAAVLQHWSFYKYTRKSK